VSLEEEGEPWPKRRMREGLLSEEEEEERLMRCCLMGEEERLVDGEEVEEVKEGTREVRDGRGVWSRGSGWKAGEKKEEEKVEVERRGMKRSA